MPILFRIVTFLYSLCVYACLCNCVRGRTKESACQTLKHCWFFGSGSRSRYNNQLDCVARTTSVSNIQTQPLYSHYCQNDAVQPSLTCSFSLISFLSSRLSCFLLLLSFPFCLPSSRRFRSWSSGWRWRRTSWKSVWRTRWRSAYISKGERRPEDGSTREKSHGQQKHKYTAFSLSLNLCDLTHLAKSWPRQFLLS